MSSLLMTLGIGLLLSTSASIDEAPVYAWTGQSAIDGGFEFTLLEDASSLPADAALLLASAVPDRDTPNRASDTWWSMEPIRIVAPREPTDPDSPGLSPGSPLETPWDAWENREDPRGDWESLDPGDR
ncbi:hypothetical protein K8I85_16375 [bacterium]|nr:hypothetical protein [bacterium]